jgi:hypothetical protein
LVFIKIEPNLPYLYLTIQLRDGVFQGPCAVFDRGMIGVSDKDTFEIAKSTDDRGYHQPGKQKRMAHGILPVRLFLLRVN